mmetsp:Transcript_17887/g.39131  ORF Transcript_17887/g.39131 Transcript_17887/m.39131 type:complete len:209 (-) Transcript_17887:830-1456(-)
MYRQITTTARARSSSPSTQAVRPQSSRRSMFRHPCTRPDLPAVAPAAACTLAVSSASTLWILAMLLIPSASVSAFATPAPRIRVTSDGASGTTSTSLQQEVGNILILDHLNINHEKGRHDLLKAFYFDFLNCAVDPRKEENIAKGTKTLWANIGAQQFHLPEGKPSAQVFDGLITLSYRNFDGLRERYRDKSIRAVLDGTKFDMEEKK